MTKTDLMSIDLESRDRLNEELGGGFPPGSIVLIEGEFEAGKSVLTQRITKGLLEEDYLVTYLSTELSISNALSQMSSLRFNIEEHLLDGELLFLHADIDHGSPYANEGKGERKQLLRRLMEADVMWEADAILIDAFDDILRNDPTFEALVRENEERQAALEIISFFRDLISTGRLVLITIDPSSVHDTAIDPFRAIADAHLKIEMVEVGNEIRRGISVKRFSGMGGQVGDRIGFSVRSDAGIVIESRSVA